MNLCRLILFGTLAVLGVAAWFMAQLTTEGSSKLLVHHVAEKDVLADIANVVVHAPELVDEVKLERHRHE